MILRTLRTRGRREERQEKPRTRGLKVRSTTILPNTFQHVSHFLSVVSVGSLLLALLPCNGENWAVVSRRLEPPGPLLRGQVPLFS